MIPVNRLAENPGHRKFSEKLGILLRHVFTRRPAGAWASKLSRTARPNKSSNIASFCTKWPLASRMSTRSCIDKAAELTLREIPTRPADLPQREADQASLPGRLTTQKGNPAVGSDFNRSNAEFLGVAGRWSSLFCFEVLDHDIIGKKFTDQTLDHRIGQRA